MRIYPDTSFLVSLLYSGDRSHAASEAFFVAQTTAEWVTSEWLLFETNNSLRQLCLARNGPDKIMIEGVRRLFKRWHERGNFTRVDADMADAVTECQQLSAAHAIALRMRSADVLHVALLEQINPDLFVTRDADQFKLASQRAFPAQLLS